MIREDKKKFHETVGILVQAYLNDTLIHQSCQHCAVGNLITATGYEFNCNSTEWLSLINRDSGGSRAENMENGSFT